MGWLRSTSQRAPAVLPAGQADRLHAFSGHAPSHLDLLGLGGEGIDFRRNGWRERNRFSDPLDFANVQPQVAALAEALF